MKTARSWFTPAFCLAACLVLSFCSAIRQGADILAGEGKISDRDRNSIVKASDALRSTFSDISEEEEYYIGRAVAAAILSRYPAVGNPELTRYVNVLGNALVLNSDRPETYAGYHFLVLDTDEVNAMAAPGGMIFVTKGLMMTCADEEMLAAVLAHEIGHVNGKHGLQSIKKSRLVDAFQLIGQETADRYGPEKLSRLTEVFEGVLGDIVATVVERGYDRKYEYEADALSVKFLSRTGYNAGGLTDFLNTLAADRSKGDPKGWFKTHPAPRERIDRAKPTIASLGGPAAAEDVRTGRFLQAIRSLR